MVYGYCRVSTKAQLKDGYSLDDQEACILERYPHAEIYKEAYTGTKLERPIFSEVVSKLQKGDTLVCVKMDRFARNTVEGITVIQNLFKRGVAVHIFNVGLLEDSPMGKFFLTTMLAVAELERNQIVERTQMGRRRAKEAAEAKGQVFKDGRPKKYTDEELGYALMLLGTHSYSEVARITGISKSTLVRLRKESGITRNITVTKDTGRPRKFAEQELGNALKLLEEHSYTEVIKQTGISKTTLINLRKEKQEEIMKGYLNG